MSVQTILTVMILLTFVSAVGGLMFGVSLDREDLDFDMRAIIAAVGNIVGIVAGLILAFNVNLSAIAYEVLGLVMSLAFLAGFMGLGLLIGPRKRR